MPPSEEKVAEMDFDVGDLPTNDSNESELHQEEKNLTWKVRNLL